MEQPWLAPRRGTRTPRTGHGKGKKEELRGISEFGQSQTLGERKAEEKAGNQGMKGPKQSNTWKRRGSKNIHRLRIFILFWLVKLFYSIGMFYKTDSRTAHTDTGLLYKKCAFAHAQLPDPLCGNAFPLLPHREKGKEIKSTPDQYVPVKNIHDIFLIRLNFDIQANTTLAFTPTKPEPPERRRRLKSMRTDFGAVKAGF